MRVDGGCHCGRITFEADIDPEKVAEKDPRVFNLRLGTVRQRAALTPRAQVWCRSALPWVMDLASIKRHAKQSM